MPARTPTSRAPARRAAPFALLALVAALVQATVATPARATAPSRPNIVVVNTDDQRFDSLYACLASVPAGRTAPTGSQCPMPHVRDDLMDHGVTFDQSFVTTALCCPSRASLFTGQYAHRTGVLTNAKPNGGIAAFRPLEDLTVARWLHDAGYRTSMVGKYLNQYTGCATPPCAVPAGWDDWHAEVTDGDGNYSDFQLADSSSPGRAVLNAYPGYYGPVIQQKAVDFIADGLSNHPGQPLFLYYAPFAPHPDAVPATGDTQFDTMARWGREPYLASWNTEPKNGPTWLKPLPADNPNNPILTQTQIDRKDREQRAEMNSLADVDRQVHAIVQALGSSASQTLIVFTSDNGISWGEHRYFNKKNCEFEECHRVPMVVRYDPLTDPGGTGPGREDATHPVLNVDIAATIAEAAGLTSPRAMDGRSFLPLLDAGSGNDPPDWRTAVLGEDFGGLVKTGVDTPTLTLIRTFTGDPAGAWKYAELCDLAASTVPCATSERELYDESSDPYEMSNLAVASPAPGSTQAVLAQRLGRIASTQPPAVSFTGGPPPATQQTGATLSFTSNGASRTWCSLDGADRAPCASPVVVPGPLAEGPHAFTVVADGSDVASGVAGTSAPAVRTWVVDTTPPDTSIDAGPTGPTSSTTAVFSFSSNESGGTFACSLDGAPFAPCSSPATFTGLTEAQHTVSVRAVDPAGNVDPAPAHRTWTVDVTPPDTAITSGPSGPVNQPGPFSFSFTSTEGGSTFQCRLSGGSYPCPSPTDVSVPGDGGFTLTVKATDAAGNTDATPATRSWTVDTQPPPAPAFTQTPTNPSGPSVSFAFDDGDGGVAFACSLDGAGPASCSSPRSFQGLSAGGHTFAVTATDPAGNTSAPAQFAWTVTLVGPDTTITSGPAEGSVTTATSATFRFTAGVSGATYSCSLDGAGFSTCVSPASYSGLGDGAHAFAVRATANGATGGPAQRTWTVDTVAPDTTITGGPSGPVSSTGPFSFAFESNETGGTFKCKLDGASYAACTSPYQLAGPLSGSHAFSVKAVDQAGNQDQTPASRTWSIDTVAPDTSITGGPSGTTTATDATFTFTATEQGSTFACSLDGAGFAPCTSPRQYAGLGVGDHAFQVRAVDAAGNLDPSPATRTWTVTPLLPDTTITSGPPDGSVSNSTSASFAFTSDAPGATFECSLDGAAFGACQSGGAGASFAGLAEGSHAFSVRAVSGGSVDPSPAARSWTVDSQPPGTAISSPAPDQLLSRTSATVKWSYSDPPPSSGGGTFTLLERQGLGGTYGPVVSGATARQATRTVGPGTTACWESVATDPAGNSATSDEVCAAAPFDDRSGSLTYTQPAAQQADGAAYRGTLTRLTGAPAEVSFTFTGRKVGLFAQRGPAAGKADVYVGGTLVKTVDLYASSVAETVSVWTKAFGSVGTHTLRVVWTGKKNASSTGTDVPVDGIAVIGSAGAPSGPIPADGRRSLR